MNKLKTKFQFGVLPKQPMKDPKLSIQAKSIFAYLCAYAGNDGQAFPSTSLMQYEMNISKNTLFKYLKELKTSGYVTVEKYKTETNQFQNNVYILNDEPCIKSCDTASCDTEICDTTINNVTKNNNTKNKTLQFSQKTDALLSFLNKLCINKFDKPIRDHKKLIDLDELYDVVIDYEDEFKEFVMRRLKTYDNYSLEYLDAIKGDFASELYEFQ